MDLFVALTIGFDLLYAFIIVRLARRDLVWINVIRLARPVVPDHHLFRARGDLRLAPSWPMRTMPSMAKSEGNK